MCIFFHQDRRSLKGSKGQICFLNIKKIIQNWLYLSLLKVYETHYCYTDVIKFVDEVYASLDPIGQSPRSKVKFLKIAPILLKLYKNVPNTVFNTYKKFNPDWRSLRGSKRRISVFDVENGYWYSIQHRNACQLWHLRDIALDSLCFGQFKSNLTQVISNTICIWYMTLTLIWPLTFILWSKMC
jgi:hypothetical protein